MQEVAGHHVGLQKIDQWRQRLHGTAAPARQCAVRNVCPHPGEDLVQATERKMVIVFGDQDKGQQAGSGEAARNGSAGCRTLDHLLTAPAGLLQPRHVDHLHLRRDHVEDLAYILAHQTQGAATVRACVTGVHLTPLTGRVGCHTGTAARSFEQFVSRVSSLGGRSSDLDGGRLHCRCDLGLGDLKPLKSQFQLLDLQGQLLGRLAEGHAAKLGELVTEGVDQRIAGRESGFELGDPGVLVDAGRGWFRHPERLAKQGSRCQ